MRLKHIPTIRKISRHYNKYWEDEMNESLESVILKKYLRLFTCANSMILECGSGWFKLIDRLLYDIDKVGKETGKTVTVSQIKEKFGGLRIYLSKRDKEIQDLIDVAEEISFHTCEQCGKYGKLRFGDIMKTLCDEHAKEWGFETKKEIKKTKIRSELCPPSKKK